MRFVFSLGLVAVALVGMTVFLHADLFRNSDLSSGLSGWHGDGRLVYLAADNTEADDSAPGSTPVIKLHLAHDSQSSYQEIEVRDNPSKLDVAVEIMASSDFRRSTEPSDFTSKWSAGGTWYWSALVVPTADFFIRGSPGYFYKVDNAPIGQWTKVEGHFENLKPTDQFTISFCVPPGEGSVYIKNPSVTSAP
jgi:hypothetical protein